MILSSFKAGQLGNRLFHISQLIVTAMETNSTLIDFSLDEYMCHFQYLAKKKVIVYPFPPQSIIKILIKRLDSNKINHIRDFIIHRKLSSRMLAFIDQQGIEMNDYEQFILNRKHYLNYIVEGWITTDKTPLHKYRQLLKEIFSPNVSNLNNVLTLMAVVRSNADIVVGIHIRRGDFRDFKGGKFFFNDNEYHQWMEQICTFYKGKSVNFLLCSNETIRTENFSKFNVTISTNHIIEDMYALSMCDLIVGPVSTYSMWASFVGEKPLFQILDRNSSFDFSKAKIINDRS